MRKYRFFYHYNKLNKKITVHYRGKCIIEKDVHCEVPTESKWNKTQPNLVVQGWAKQVKVINNTIFIK